MKTLPNPKTLQTPPPPPQTPCSLRPPPLNEPRSSIPRQDLNLLFDLLDQLDVGRAAAPTKPHHRNLPYDASEQKIIFPSFAGDGSGETEAASPIENPSAERPKIRLQIWQRRGASPRVCEAGVFFRRLTPSRRFSPPPISSLGVDRVCSMEPVWDPGLLEFRAENGEAPVGRRKLAFERPPLGGFQGCLLWFVWDPGPWMWQICDQTKLGVQRGLPCTSIHDLDLWNMHIQRLLNMEIWWCAGFPKLSCVARGGIGACQPLTSPTSPSSGSAATLSTASSTRTSFDRCFLSSLSLLHSPFDLLSVIIHEYALYHRLNMTHQPLLLLKRLAPFLKYCFLCFMFLHCFMLLHCDYVVDVPLSILVEKGDITMIEVLRSSHGVSTYSSDANKLVPEPMVFVQIEVNPLILNKSTTSTNSENVDLKVLTKLFVVWTYKFEWTAFKYFLSAFHYSYSEIDHYSDYFFMFEIYLLILYEIDRLDKYNQLSWLILGEFLLEARLTFNYFVERFSCSTSPYKPRIQTMKIVSMLTSLLEL